MQNQAKIIDRLARRGGGRHGNCGRQSTRTWHCDLFFSVNIAAYLIGSNLIGFLNDKLGATENPVMMRYALLVCPASCAVSAVCLWLGSRSFYKSEI